MSLESFLLFLLVGAVVGWLAGQLTKGSGFGLLGNIVVGVVGAILGGFLFRALGFYPGGGLLTSLITALVGALVLVFVVRLIKRS